MYVCVVNVTLLERSHDGLTFHILIAHKPPGFDTAVQMWTCIGIVLGIIFGLITLATFVMGCVLMMKGHHPDPDPEHIEDRGVYQELPTAMKTSAV
jgi:hypothetical protein